MRVYVDAIRRQARHKTYAHDNMDSMPACAASGQSQATRARKALALSCALSRPMHPRLRQALTHMAEGMINNDDLAKTMSLSVRTIERYRKLIRHIPLIPLADDS
jgi:DNA-directed RNA polymerase specialized sigma24 family protein